MEFPRPDARDWHALAHEAPLDPQQRIVDPHHHLWPAGPGRARYLLAELWADTGCGHRVEQTVYVECRSGYRDEGPEHLRSVGEADFVARIARASRDGGGGAAIAGFVGHVDLRLPPPLLDEALHALRDASGGLLRGIRHSGACDPQPHHLSIPGRGAPGLYHDPDFRRGVAWLGERGYRYDTWHYHHQNADFAALARAVPATTMVLDHFGTPLGVGRFAGQHDALFPQWQRDIAAIADCPNVVAKLGGLAMPDNGFGWDRRARPPSSDELVAAQGRWYRHAIGCFGPERCMFESNFPVDSVSLGYGVYWNAMKKIAADLPAAAREALFHGTATRVYRLAPGA